MTQKRTECRWGPTTTTTTKRSEWQAEHFLPLLTTPKTEAATFMGEGIRIRDAAAVRFLKFNALREFPFGGMSASASAAASTALQPVRFGINLSERQLQII